MSKKKRIQIIKKIQEKRNSLVITYVLSDRPNSEGYISQDAVREIYDLLCDLRPGSDKKALDLFLCAAGGDAEVSWQIVSMVREIFSEFNVIIPYKAHGAATMMALGADSIVMGERGELTTIKVTLAKGGAQGENEDGDLSSASIGDVESFFSLLESLGTPRVKQKVDALLRTLDTVSPLVLGRLNNATEQYQEVCMKLLESRKRRFRKGVNKKIVHKLISGQERTITRSQALKDFGLKQVKQDTVLEPLFWELFKLYEDALEMGAPFYPDQEMDQCSEEEIVFRDHRLAYIETANKTRVFKQDVKLRKVRQPPPNIHFDPQIVLPPFQIPSGPEANEDSITSNIQQWLEDWLPGVVREAFEKLSRSFPISAYERLDLNKRWEDE